MFGFAVIRFVFQQSQDSQQGFEGVEWDSFEMDDEDSAAGGGRGRDRDQSPQLSPQAIQPQYKKNRESSSSSHQQP